MIKNNGTSREILFRGKNIVTNKWVEGYYKRIGGVTLIEEAERAGVSHYVDPQTVGQYVNRTDKNGRRIFEGDIVKSEIYCDVGCYPHTETRIFRVEISDFYRRDIYGNNIEVIGNVYDNPELLEVSR